MIKLKELRLEKGLTQQELSKLIDISQMQISKYEKGKIEPNIETLIIFADFFEVSIDYFVGRKDFIE